MLILCKFFAYDVISAIFYGKRQGGVMLFGSTVEAGASFLLFRVNWLSSTITEQKGLFLLSFVCMFFKYQNKTVSN